MEAIKKKMLAMKMEKENAMDKAEELTNKLRETEESKAKVEEDLGNLQKKYANLENDFDSANEQLTEAQTKLETQEKRITELKGFEFKSHPNNTSYWVDVGRFRANTVSISQLSAQ